MDKLQWDVSLHKSKQHKFPPMGSSGLMDLQSPHKNTSLWTMMSTATYTTPNTSNRPLLLVMKQSTYSAVNLTQTSVRTQCHLRKWSSALIMHPWAHRQHLGHGCGDNLQSHCICTSDSVLQMGTTLEDILPPRYQIYYWKAWPHYVNGTVALFSPLRSLCSCTLSTPPSLHQQQTF